MFSTRTEYPVNRGAIYFRIGMALKMPPTWLPERNKIVNESRSLWSRASSREKRDPASRAQITFTDDSPKKRDAYNHYYYNYQKLKLKSLYYSHQVMQYHPTDIMQLFTIWRYKKDNVKVLSILNFIHCLLLAWWQSISSFLRMSCMQ
jgi:hypothetical protein